MLFNLNILNIIKKSIHSSFLFFLFTIAALPSLPIRAAKKDRFSQNIPFDPFFWLESIRGKKSIEWVKSQNKETLEKLEAHPRYQQILAEAKNILYFKEKAAFGYFSHGKIWNFWQDKDHPQGILRRTSVEDYKNPNPQWENILDFDQLSKKEKETWVYSDHMFLDRHSNRILLFLSRGGQDAEEVREFDVEKKQFVKNGFYLPESKVYISPLSEDQILVASSLEPHSTTQSGYGKNVKMWTRGTSFSEAPIVFQVKEEDILARSLVQDEKDKPKEIFFMRSIDFSHRQLFWKNSQEEIEWVPIPQSAEIIKIKNDYIYFLLKESLKLETINFPINSLMRIRVGDKNLNTIELIYTPEPQATIEELQVVNKKLFITLLENVKNQILELTPSPSEKGVWKKRILPFSSNGILRLSMRDEERDPNDISLLYFADFLTPYRQYLVHDDDNSFNLELIKSAPSFFDSSSLQIDQYFAKSKDGISIPYFIIHPKKMSLNGQNPTELYGYGGFEISLSPFYDALIGKIWLEKGMTYVVANIRGGGEFGAEWHKAAIKENRQVAFDDFIAVAEDLIHRGITSPQFLGINGGSNGGLLVGSVMVQRPELFQAAVIEVPLLDMIRYTKLLVGASWKSEYGDPDNPKDCKNLLKYSPYHNLSPQKKYPTPLFLTSSADDRVHPAHARKMAIRMQEQGHSVYFYESLTGGHSGADLNERARVIALHYTYLFSRLLDDTP